MKTRLASSLLLVCALALPAAAEPTTTLRVATEAPDGTAWARLFRAMSRDLEGASNGAVAIKWYFGGIAGNEVQMLDRLRRNQLDVVMSGGMLCMKLSPSMRALRLLGLFQTRAEAAYVLGRLRPTIDKELAAGGYRYMGSATLGSDMMFTRVPVASLADMKKQRFWFWDLDEPMRVQLKALGIPAVGLAVEDALRAYEEKRTDGFLSIPTAALAYQWSAKTPYLTDLRLGYLPGCMIMTNHAFDALTLDERRALNDATAKFQLRLEELGRSQDAELLGKLFARQGVKQVVASAAFTSEFFEAARTAREALRDKLIPGELIDKVIGWVADYRAEYRTGTN